jgi:hypothetical protein
VRSFLKDNATPLFLLLFILTLSPLVMKLFVTNHENQQRKEMYNPELSHLNSVSKVLDYCDSIYSLNDKGTELDTAKYVFTVSRIIKERFYHASLDYSFSENWIAKLSGQIFWSHLSSIVMPEDILKHKRGLCSQQTIVFMELLRAKHINVRSVGLGRKEGPGHFLCEAHYNNSWHLHDVSEEPEWDKIVNHHQSMGYYVHHKDSLYKVYEAKMSKDVFYTILRTIDYGKVNEMPAAHMRLFHNVTRATTYILPIIFLGLFLYAYRRKRVTIKEFPGTDKQEERVSAEHSIQTN